MYRALKLLLPALLTFLLLVNHTSCKGGLLWRRRRSPTQSPTGPAPLSKITAGGNKNLVQVKRINVEYNPVKIALYMHNCFKIILEHKPSIQSYIPDQCSLFYPFPFYLQYF
jgi:hypothetical protein